LDYAPGGENQATFQDLRKAINCALPNPDFSFLLEFFLQLLFQFGYARLGESETIFVIT